MTREIKGPSREGRTVPFTEVHKALARRLFAENPSATRARICRLFERESGRAISVATLDRMHARPEVEVVVPDGPLPRPRVGHYRLGHNETYTDAERDILVRLLRERPGATSGQVAKLFGEATGRAISRGGVYYARRRLQAYAGPRSHLTDGQREVLRRIVSETDRDTPCSEIAGAFAAETGRMIAARTVSEFMKRALGLPPIGAGRNCQSHRRRLVEARLESARALKLESAPVDRSVRPGRTSRVTA
jgi:hypothetical protein